MPAYVTLVGDGPATALENVDEEGTRGVVVPGDHAAVRSLGVTHASSTAGAGGILGGPAIGVSVDDVVVDARVGIEVAGGRVRDSVVSARSTGLSLVPSTIASRVDDVTVRVSGIIGATGVVVGGTARLDGVSVTVQSTSSTGVVVTAASGLVELRGSDVSAVGVSSGGVGLRVDPAAASSVRVVVSASTVSGGGSPSYGVRTDGSGATTRIGGSILGGGTEVDEDQPADARCVGTYDSGYVTEVSC